MVEDYHSPPHKKSELEIETISELVEDGNIFDSHGYSLVKVTKAGLEKIIKLPIKSTGVYEFQRELSGKAPRPPVLRQMIKKNSPEGRALGLPHDQILQIFDTTDETYIDQLNAHNDDVIWRVTIFALDIDFKKADKSIAAGYEEKKQILQKNGITWNHINQIYDDVQALTRLNEEQEDFLSGNSSG